VNLPNYLVDFITKIFEYIDWESSYPPEDIVIATKLEGEPLEFPFEKGSTDYDFPCVFINIDNWQLTPMAGHYIVQTTFRVTDIIDTRDYEMPKIEAQTRMLKIAKNLALSNLGGDGLFTLLSVNESTGLNSFFETTTIPFFATEIMASYQISFDEDL